MFFDTIRCQANMGHFTKLKLGIWTLVSAPCTQKFESIICIRQFIKLTITEKLFHKVTQHLLFIYGDIHKIVHKVSSFYPWI